MWDLDTIVELNKPARVPRMGIFQLRDGVYALGYRGARAISVVRRTSHGKYLGVRGRKPVIEAESLRLEKPQISLSMKAALNRVAAGVAP
jgi:hypothetical protein